MVITDTAPCLTLVSFLVCLSVDIPARLRTMGLTSYDCMSPEKYSHFRCPGTKIFGSGTMLRFPKDFIFFTF